MMGMATLFFGGKAFAGLFGAAMVFKLRRRGRGSVAERVGGRASFRPDRDRLCG